MNFLSPLMLVGLVAMVIPPLLHLLLRRKPKRVQFPALEFILVSHKKTSRRFQIHQLALMLIRCLFLGVLAMAIARPILSNSQDGSVDFGADGGTLIIVVDNSYTMGYQLDGESLLNHARIMAGNALDRPGVQAALVIGGTKPIAPFDQVSGDVEAVLQALNAVEVGTHPRRLNAATSMAYSMFSSQKDVQDAKVIVLSSPAGLENLPSPPENSGIELIPIDVSKGQPLPNRSVLGLELKPAPRIGAGYWELNVQIANHSADDVDHVPIQVELERRVLVNGFVTLEAGKESTKTFYFSLDRDQYGPARIVMESDALSVDDDIPFWLSPAPPMRILAINGDPNSTPFRDELFYLKKIAKPALTSGARMEIKSTTPDRLDSISLREFDVIVLSNVPDISADAARNIRTFVEGGGGLFLTVGNRVQPKRLNQLLGPILPRTLRNSRVSGDAAASIQGRDRGVSLIKSFNSDHPILGEISRPQISSLALVQIKKYMLLDPSPNAGGQVVMSLDDGAPLLLTSEYGRGRVALLATTIDRDWTDLPIRPHFLPLMVDTFRYLTRIRAVDPQPVFAGQPADIKVSGDDVENVKVRGPKGQVFASARPDGDESQWQFTQTKSLGHYRIENSQGRSEIGGFAVRVDPVNARLNQAIQVDGAESEGRSTSLVEERTELWHWALLLLFILLASEAALLFKRHLKNSQENLSASR